MTTSLPPTARPPPFATPSLPAGNPFRGRNRLVNQGAWAHQGPVARRILPSPRRHGIA